VTETITPADFRRGLLAHVAGDAAAAEAHYRRALAAPALEVLASRHLVALLDEQRRWADALAECQAASARHPDDPELESQLGLRLLAAGRYREGWARYESRARTRAGATRPQLALPEWDGAPVRSLSVWDEQGAGDCLMFARFLPWLRSRGVERVTLVCRPELAPLMATLDGVEVVPAAGQIRMPTTEAWAMLGSLPYRLGVELADLPGPTPYLSAPPDRASKWRGRVSPSARIGVAPRTRPIHEWPARALPPAAAAFLLSLPGALPISPEEAGAPGGDFADTAAVVDQLQLVISADTAAAHLAGAMGKPCWLLLPHAADWRWLHDRTDSPWYPSMRIYRQPAPGDWASVLRAVAQDIPRFFGQA